MKFVLIIPTKDRPKDIQRLFESIEGQLRKPDLVIVVDGSDNPVKHIVDQFQSSLQIHYIPCRPPSLPKQRNAGIEQIPQDADWVGFLDDDLVLEPDTLYQLEKMILEKNDIKIKGIGLSILNQTEPKMKSFLRLFLMSGPRYGRITKAGYPTAIPCVQEDIETDWIYGGATFWARDIFQKFKFDEWFFGTGYMEDIDFSYRISRQYKLMISSKAQCNHYHHQIPIHKEASMGEWQMTSWWYFITKHHDFSILFVSWAMFGLILKNLLAVCVYRTKPYVERSKGHFRGIARILFGTAKELRGFSKQGTKN